MFGKHPIQYYFPMNSLTKQISVHGYLRHYSRQEFTCSLLSVEPEAVSSLWETTEFDKCINLLTEHDVYVQSCIAIFKWV
jgi:hypothetical protein